MKHQDNFKKKYGFDAIEFVEKADLEYFGLAKTLGIQAVLKEYAEKKGINIELNDEFYKHLIECFAEDGKKFPYNEKISFQKDLYSLEPTPINPSVPKSKGVLEDFKDIVSDDVLRPQFEGVYVSDDGFLYGTDAHKLIKYKNNDYSEYVGKLINIDTYIASKGKKIDFIDAIAPQYEAVIPKDNPNIEKGLPTYNFYNLTKSVIALKRLQSSDVFSIIFDFKGEIFGFNPVLMNDVFHFALCKGFEKFNLEYSTPNRAIIFKFENDSLGLLMPVMVVKEGLVGTTKMTIEKVISDYGMNKKSSSKPSKEKITKSEIKEVPYKKYEGSIENTSYVPRRDIAYIILRNGEKLSGNDIIDGVYKIKKMAHGGNIEAENAEMVKSYNKQIAHHTKEMNKAMNKNGEVPAWVVAKMTRSASDLSDATHFMEGKGEKYAKGGGVDVKMPLQGTMISKDKKKQLNYKKVGNNYELIVYEGEPITLGNFSRTSFKKKTNGVFTMNYNQFINYIYTEGYVDDKMYEGGGVGNDIYYGVIDSNNNLVFQSKNEREAKQFSYSYGGFIVKKYSGKGKIHQYALGGGVGNVKVGDTIYRAWFIDDDGEKGSVIIKANSLEEAEKKANLIDNGDGYFSYVSNPIKIQSEEQLFEETRNNEPIYQYADGGGVGSIPKSIMDKINEINDLIEWAKDKDNIVGGYFGGTHYEYLDFEKPITTNNQFVYIEYNKGGGSRASDKYNVNKKGQFDSEGLVELKAELSRILSAFKRAKKKYDEKGYFKSGGTTNSQKRKVGKVMHEFKEGTLHSGKSGKVVKNPKQAVAIALSEAGLAKKENGGAMGWKSRMKNWKKK